jgi:hypothetical protein
MRNALIAALLLIWVTPEISHAGIGKAVARGAARGVAKSAGRGVARAAERKAGQRAAQIFRKDMWNHRHTPPAPLPQSRTVHRYTSSRQGTQELRKGILPGNHMTATAPPGRSLRPDAAQKRYGLSGPPQVRETIVLPRGFPARHNNVPGGQPGIGEITSPKRVPPQAIKKITPLR